ncbi:hypothetical protein KI387_043270, partial [Taxus chinensis]
GRSSGVGPQGLVDCWGVRFEAKVTGSRGGGCLSPLQQKVTYSQKGFLDHGFERAFTFLGIMTG